MSGASRPPYRRYLARTLSGLVIPQGYTLSLSGALVVAVHRYGLQDWLQAWGFVVGAVGAFTVLVIVCGQGLEMSLSDLDPHGRAFLNVVPILGVLVSVAVVYAIPWPSAGFIAGGAVAAGGYVLLVSAFFRLVSPVSSQSVTDSAERAQ